MRIFSLLLKYSLKVIFPHFCLSCSAYVPEDEFICTACKKSIPLFSSFVCPKCSRRLLTLENRCHQREGFILGAASAYSARPVRELIYALKYRRTQDARLLENLLSAYMGDISRRYAINFTSYVLIPIPMHPVKRMGRGFNQTELLGGKMSSLFSIPMNPNALAKTRNTLPQAEIKSAREREENVLGSFTLKNRECVAGKSVILFDDVFTSGATMREAVRVLKKSGAKDVIGIVVAKT